MYAAVRLNPSLRKRLLWPATIVRHTYRLQEFCAVRVIGVEQRAQCEAIIVPNGCSITVLSRCLVQVSNEDLYLSANRKGANVIPFAQSAAQQGSNKIPAVCSVLTNTTERHVDSLPHVSEAKSQKKPNSFHVSQQQPPRMYGDQSFPVERGNLVVLDSGVPCTAPYRDSRRWIHSRLI